MERQRYLEWEKQRIQDLENHHKKELEYVTAMRERSKKLNADYQSLVNSRSLYLVYSSNTLSIIS